MKRAARHEIYREVLEEWLRRSPGQARETIRYIKEVTAQDVRDGKWQATDAGAQLQIRFPSDLFFLLRACIPGWGDDNADLKEFLREFPDLIPAAMRKRIGLHRDGKRERHKRSAERVARVIARDAQRAEDHLKGRSET
jgi:hypothetical protein